MSIQYEIDKKLFYEVLSTQPLESKKELRKRYSCDVFGEKDKTRYNSFNVSYGTLEELEILEKEQLSDKYKSQLKQQNIDALVTILLPNILYYRRKSSSAMKEKKTMSNKDYNESMYKEQIDTVRLDTKELLDRFIINSKKIPNKTYDDDIDHFRIKQSFREFAFKELLFYFLHHSEKKSFLIEDIRERIRDYYANEVDDIDDLYDDVISAFMLLKIITKKDSYNYYIEDITDGLWKMSPRVKSESIHTLIGGITDLSDDAPSKEIIDAVHKIFNFSN